MAEPKKIATSSTLPLMSYITYVVNHTRKKYATNITSSSRLVGVVVGKESGVGGGRGRGGVAGSGREVVEAAAADAVHVLVVRMMVRVVVGVRRLRRVAAVDD